MVEQLKEKFNVSVRADDSSSLPRKEAFDIFEKKGIPTRKEEEYKYTDLARVFNKLDLTAVGSDDSATLPEILPELDANRLVYVNGIYDTEKSQILDSELNISSLSEGNEITRKHLGQYAAPGLDAMLALNTAFTEGGVCIHLPKNVQISRPIVIHHHVTGSTGPLTYSRQLVVAEQGAEAQFIEIQTSSSTEYLLNAVTEVVVPDNAHVSWVKIQNDSEKSNIIDHHYIHQTSNSRSTLTTISLNGDVIRNNVNITVDGENAEANLYGLYLLDGKTHVDNHTSVDHCKPHSVSNELYKGILDEKAHGVFNGKVYVRQDAQKTNAFQSNKNILISDNAVINTKPQLEIWADDVKCSHGCTTGQLDQEAMFYLRTRGLSKENARALLMHAFALEAIEHLHGTPVGLYVERLVAKKLKFHGS